MGGNAAEEEDYLLYVRIGQLIASALDATASAW